MKRLLLALALVLALLPSAAFAQAVGNGAAGTSYTPYDTTALANAALTHYWPMNDVAGSTSAADAKGGVNLAVNGTVTFGTKVITRDNETAVFFDSASTDFLTFPNTPLIPASGAYTVEMVSQTSLTQGNNVFFSADANKDLDFYWGFQTTNIFAYNNNTSAGTTLPAGAITMFPGATVLVDFVCTAGARTQIYLNAVKWVDTSATCGRQGGAGKVGNFANTTAPYGGYIAKLAIFNDAETQAQIATRLANM